MIVDERIIDELEYISLRLPILQIFNGKGLTYEEAISALKKCIRDIEGKRDKAISLLTLENF